MNSSTGLKTGEINVMMAGEGGRSQLPSSIVNPTTITGTIEIVPKPSIRAVAITQIIDDEVIVYTLPAPARHHHVIKLIVDSVGKYKPAKEDQGFITDGGKFVTRKQAAILALACGQVKRLIEPSTGELFSEDLW